MNTVVVDGVPCPNTIRWRVEVKRNRGASPDEWRLFLEGIVEPFTCRSAVEFHGLRGRPSEPERVDRVIHNLLSRIGGPIDVCPFVPWDQEKSNGAGWGWMRLIGDST